MRQVQYLPAIIRATGNSLQETGGAIRSTGGTLRATGKRSDAHAQTLRLGSGQRTIRADCVSVLRGVSLDEPPFR